MVWISFLKPDDLQHEYRLRKATPEEYWSQEYYRAILQCPESEEKLAFFESNIPAMVNRFKKSIFSDNPAMIVAALRAMSDSPVMTSGGVHPGEILDATGKILTHKEPEVRRAACEFLSAFREPTIPPDIIRSLIPLLEDSAADVRAAAGETVAMHGKEAVFYAKQSVLNLLSRPEAGMRTLGVRAIAKYSEYQRGERHNKQGDPELVLPLRKLLFQTADEGQLKNLFFILGNLGYPEYFQDLEKFYPDPNPRIQENVITMMRFEATIAEREKALAYFVRSLQSQDSNVRYAAVAGIDHLGDKSQVDSLEILLKTEKQPSLRKHLKNTISRLAAKR
jgi:hypothetical protein